MVALDRSERPAILKTDGAAGRRLFPLRLLPCPRFRLSSDSLTIALAMFDRGEYFESHELLEDLWREAPPGDERTCLQGLVQVAVALCHDQRGNEKGARGVYQRARARLLALPPQMLGIDLAELAEELDRYFGGELGAGPPRLTRVERLTQTTEESDAGTLTRDIVL